MPIVLFSVTLLTYTSPCLSLLLMLITLAPPHLAATQVDGVWLSAASHS